MGNLTNEFVHMMQGKMHRKILQQLFTTPGRVGQRKESVLLIRSQSKRWTGGALGNLTNDLVYITHWKIDVLKDFVMHNIFGCKEFIKTYSFWQKHLLSCFVDFKSFYSKIKWAHKILHHLNIIFWKLFHRCAERQFHKKFSCLLCIHLSETNKGCSRVTSS